MKRGKGNYTIIIPGKFIAFAEPVESSIYII